MKFKELKKKIESKRNSKCIFWKLLISIKDLAFNFLVVISFLNSIYENHRLKQKLRGSNKIKIIISKELKGISNVSGNKLVVYTAIFGNKDVLSALPKSIKDIDFVCFTDNPYLKSDTFKIVLVERIFEDPTREARRYKVLSHKLFPNYKYSLWIDGNVQFKTKKIINWVLDELKSKDMAVFRHPDRNCIYEEARQCVAEKKDYPELISKQIKKYLSEGYPRENGLVMTSIVMRKNTKEVGKLNEVWWSEIEKFSRRDQLSFNFVIWKNKFKCKIINEDINNNKYFQRVRHKYISSYFNPKYLLKNLFSRIPEITRRYAIRSSCKISIVVPVYNALDHLKELIQSIKAQTDKDFELILVDDGSNSSTKNYLKSIKLNDYKLITNKKNLGYTKSINIGLKQSKGTLKVLLNSDTKLPTNFVSELRRVADTNIFADIFGVVSNAASYQSVPVRQDSSGTWKINNLPESCTIDDLNSYLSLNMENKLIKTELLNGFCFVVRQKVFDKVGYFDENLFPQGYGEEDDFFIRCKLAKVKSYIIPCIYVYHTKTKSFTPESRKKLCKENRNKINKKYGPFILSRMANRSKRNKGLAKVRKLIAKLYPDIKI